MQNRLTTTETPEMGLAKDTNLSTNSTNIRANLSNRAPSYTNNKARESLRQSLQHGRHLLTDGDLIAALHTGKHISVNRAGTITRLRLQHGYLEKSEGGGPWVVAQWLGLDLWRKGRAAIPIAGGPLTKAL